MQLPRLELPKHLPHASGGVLRLRDELGIDFRAKPKVSEPLLITEKTISALLRKGACCEAESLLKGLLGENPCSRFAIFELIRVYSHKGDVRSAEILFDYAESRSLAGDGIFFSMMECYGRNGRQKEAELIFEMAAARGKLCHGSFDSLLGSMERSDGGEKSRMVFERAIEAGLASESMFTRVISLMARRCPIKEASELFRAHRKEFGSVRSYTSMIRAFSDAGELSSAVWYFEEALSRKIADPIMAQSMILGHFKNGYSNLARPCYEKAVFQGIEHGDMARAMADGYLDAGQSINAFRFIKSAQKKTALPIRIYMDAVSKLASDRLEDEASNLLVSALRLGRIDCDGAERVLSRLYADSLYKSLLDIARRLPDDVRSSLPIIIIRADAMRKLGMYLDAIEILESVTLRTDVGEEQRAKARAIKAFCLKDSGRKNEAMRLFLSLFRAVPTEFHCSTRIACGLVFCWEEQRYDALVRSMDIAEARRRLERSLPGSQGSLRHDIECALKAIKRSLALEESGPISAGLD